MEKLQERVITKREAKGWNPSELARATGVGVQNIQQHESGEVKNPSYLLELAEALGCPPYWLKFGRYGKQFIDAAQLKRCYCSLDKIVEAEEIILSEDERHQVVAKDYSAGLGEHDADLKRDILRVLVRMKSNGPSPPFSFA